MAELMSAGYNQINLVAAASSGKQQTSKMFGAMLWRGFQSGCENHSGAEVSRQQADQFFMG